MHEDTLDGKILEELQLELRWMPGVAVQNDAVEATVKAGVATLTGHVTDLSIRRVAELVARRVLGVRSVINEIKIHHPSKENQQDSDRVHATLEDFSPGQQSLA